MNATALDPGDYSGTYKLVGGEISLDFVNTVSWPGRDREHDWLDRPENFTAWAKAAALIGARTRNLLDARPLAQRLLELQRVSRIRRDLRAVLVPMASADRPSRDAIATLNSLIRRAGALRQIDPQSQHWIWVEPKSFTDVLAPVVWNAARVITELPRDRIGRCAKCDWLFYDNTRNKSRRWCDMSDCGSRDKALRYYRRTKSEP